jgi:AraC-like DNA-binding protein
MKTAIAAIRSAHRPAFDAFKRSVEKVWQWAAENRPSGNTRLTLAELAAETGVSKRHLELMLADDLLQPYSDGTVYVTMLKFICELGSENVDFASAIKSARYRRRRADG